MQKWEIMQSTRGGWRDRGANGATGIGERKKRKREREREREEASGKQNGKDGTEGCFFARRVTRRETPTPPSRRAWIIGPAK